MKEKIDEMDFLKIKNFFASKVTNQKVKIQPTVFKKVFAHYLSDVSLSRVYQEVLQCVNIKANNPSLKMNK